MSEDEEQRPQADNANISDNAANDGDLSAPTAPPETPADDEAATSVSTTSEVVADAEPAVLPDATDDSDATDDADNAPALFDPPTAAATDTQAPLLPGVPGESPAAAPAAEEPEQRADALSAIIATAESAPSTLTVLSAPDTLADAAAGALPTPPGADAAPGAPDAPFKSQITFDWRDDHIPPLRLTPFQRPRKVKPLVWGGLAGAALLLLLPALLASILWPALGLLGLASPFSGPPDNLPRGARAWATATTTTPLVDDDANFGAQTYPVDAQLAAGYAAHGGLGALGAAVTPAFTCNLGLVQFFANGALLRESQGTTPQSVSTAADHDLAPALAHDGDLDAATDTEWLPLSHALLTGGSAALIGGAGSDITYAKLRKATLAVELRAEPASVKQRIKPNAPLPQSVAQDGGAFVVEGTRGGKYVGHSIPEPIWSYVTQRQIAPHGWQRDIGEPLTEPLPLTVTGSDGQPRHLLAQAFWQTIIISDLDAPQATTMQPIGLDYLHTFGAPTAFPSAGGRFWTTQDGALRTAPGASAVAVSLNTNAAVTLTGAAQWSQGALWYAVNWASPSRKGSAWVAMAALSTTQPSGPTTAGFDALSPGLASYLSGIGDDVGVQVDDLSRNMIYTYHPNNRFIMASSAKVPLLVSYLTLIESRGRGPNGYELATMTAMIEHSDNNAAQVIYDTIGDDSGQQGYMQSWGITDYSPNPNGWGWGAWSPSDMAHLLSLLQAGKVLNSSDRALAFHLMESIESDQRFGVGDTAPSNATVAMKDGWVPGPDGSWFVNTSGIVTVGSETYIITVYTGEQNSFGSGQNIVNHVCGAVAQAMV
jgi:beta-lactamase class A